MEVGFVPKIIIPDVMCKYVKLQSNTVFLK